MDNSNAKNGSQKSEFIEIIDFRYSKIYIDKNKIECIKYTDYIEFLEYKHKNQHEYEYGYKEGYNCIILTTLSGKIHTLYKSHCIHFEFGNKIIDKIILQLNQHNTINVHLIIDKILKKLIAMNEIIDEKFNGYKFVDLSYKTIFNCCFNANEYEEMSLILSTEDISDEDINKYTNILTMMLEKQEKEKKEKKEKQEKEKQEKEEKEKEKQEKQENLLEKINKLVNCKTCNIVYLIENKLITHETTDNVIKEKHNHYHNFLNKNSIKSNCF